MKNFFIAGMAAVLLSATASAQSPAATTANGKIGKLPLTTFEKNNAKGNEMVAAIQPTETPLNATDKKLLMQVAAGGQLQLAVSQAALEKVETPEAKILAQSEVEEQTGVSAKLKEIATAKGVTLPEGPDAAAQTMIEKMQGMSGTALDAFYVRESGVKGHIKLQTTMSKVLATAKDPALRKLATATLPVIKMHLTVSTDVSRTMATSGAKKAVGAK